MTEPARRAALEQVLAEHGLPMERLCEGTQALAFFGSRAFGCERSSSDWDLLCVGAGRSRKLGRLDLVWADARALEDAAWLGGDLAGHVAAYGTWLHGNCPWRSADIRFDLAAKRKEQQVVRRVRSVGRVWELLGPAYRDKHAVLLRREVQRLELLGRSVPVPPTMRLDLDWSGGASDLDRLSKELAWFGADPLLAKSIARHAGGAEDGRSSTIAACLSRLSTSAPRSW
jgi:hypothetical protein